MRPILFSVGPVSILTYGVVLTLALFLTLFITWRLYKNNLAFIRFRVTLDSFFDSTLTFLVTFGIGARLMHIAQHWDFFGTNPLLWILFLHFPGFSFLGGVVGGFLGLWLFCRAGKLPYFLLLDLMAIGLSFALGFSRIGSLLHGDAYGRETEFFFRIAIEGLPGMRHPTQVYEAFLAFAIFGFLYYLTTRQKLRAGEIAAYFLLLIGITRFSIEFLRGDSVYLGGFALAHLISGIFIVIAASFIVFMRSGEIQAFVQDKLLRNPFKKVYD